ncbi:MAG: inorganic diphosphatase [Patescibacteria group bacterium]
MPTTKKNQTCRQLYLQYLNKIADVIIDRPINSLHPEHKFRYLANYGFIPNTKAPDGEEIDAYVLAVDKPIKEFKGVVIAIIHRLNDNDDKLVVVPDGKNLTDKNIKDQTYFQEKYFESEIIR